MLSKHLYFLMGAAVLLALIVAVAAALGVAGLFSGGGKAAGRTLRLSSGNLVTLDPALAADVVSQYMVASFHDTPLQYDYLARPYRLQPSMLAAMPEVDEGGLTYRFTLRDDLFFTKDECFGDNSPETRRIRAGDVVFSLLRLADARLRSPGFWTLRGKVRGINEFNERTAAAPPGDMTPYDEGCEGLEVVDGRRFAIHLLAPDPRLLYSLAMPYAGVVSRRAVERYGDDLAFRPVGSGPFVLEDWWRDFRVIAVANTEYRPEYFPAAANPADRARRLPLVDRIECYLVAQPLSAWLMFLQGGMDMTNLDADNFELVVDENRQISPALAERGVRMFQIPSFRVNYVGFSFTDPLLAGNLDLRKALSLAYNVERRIVHSNHRLLAANGPIPHGVAGHDESLANPYSRHDLELAREYLAKAGFPGGVDPLTGAPLELKFDLAGNSSAHRQHAEMTIDDLAAIGVKVEASLNHAPRFFQKLRQGDVQMFRLSWVGDYPDAENFLQLFYGPNSGGCNRAAFRDPEFDRMYEEVATMPESDGRTEKYRRMVEYLVERCPWIFESFPVDYRLVHGWVENYAPHDFAFAGWKYLAVDERRRGELTQSFRPLSSRELRVRHQTAKPGD